MNNRQVVTRQLTIAVSMVLGLLSSTTSLSAQLQIRELCDVKGQEINNLRGIGLVVGLPGTGDPNIQTTQQALGRLLVNSGIELPLDALGQQNVESLQGVTNVALVTITAKVPAAGAREGTLIDCEVQAFGNAKSLQGGTLVTASMTGGLATGDSGALLTLATAAGSVEVDPTDVLTVGKIRNGCRMALDLENKFYYFEEQTVDEYGAPLPPGTGRKQMYIDLVVRNEHVSFSTSSRVADAINSRAQLYGDRQDQAFLEEGIAFPKDQRTVRLKVPESQQLEPVNFLREVMDIAIFELAGPGVVWIDRKTGVVLMSDNVYFRACAVSTPEFAIERGTFAALSLDDTAPLEGGQQRRLTELVDALNALQAPPQTIVNIIEGLDEMGCLYGRVRYRE